jgi:hypothetical protein
LANRDSDLENLASLRGLMAEIDKFFVLNEKHSLKIGAD